MNRKILSIIVIIGLLGSASAAAGVAGAPIACAAGAAAGIQNCAGNTADPAVATTGAANCNAGYAFNFVSVSASTCDACAVNTW